jgi:hypothetical protein
MRGEDDEFILGVFQYVYRTRRLIALFATAGFVTARSSERVLQSAFFIERYL